MALWVGSVAGCAGLGPLTAPTATVSRVTVASQTPHGVRVEIDVELTNPNTVPLPLVDAHYRLTIRDVGSFAFNDRVFRTIPASTSDDPDAVGRQIITLPVAFELPDPSTAHGIGHWAYDAKGKISYEPPGEIRKLLTESNLPLPTTSFRAAGQVQPTAPARGLAGSHNPPLTPDLPPKPGP